MPAVIRYSAYNNSIVVGGINRGVTYRMMLLNYNTNGTLRWENEDEQVKGIYDEIIDNDGNIIAGALLTNYGKVYNGTPGLCKFAADGSFIGQHLAFTNGYFYGTYRVFNIAADNQQHYYLFCENADSLHYGIIIKKYNLAGKLLNDIKITTTDSLSFYYLYAAHMSVDSIQNVFVSLDATAKTIFQANYYTYDCTSKYSFTEAATEKRETLEQSTMIANTIIYPNPASGKLYIKTTGKTAFALFNFLGKQVLIQSINNTGMINLANLSSGTYFLRNLADNTSQKIVIIK